MFSNLSFETIGSSPGQSLGWTWTHACAFHFASFVRVGVLSRFESLEGGWSNDVFVGALVLGTSSTAATFGNAGPLAPSPVEDFEAQWRMPAPVALDPTDLGNALSWREWEFGQAALFAGALEETFNWPVLLSSYGSAAWQPTMHVETFEVGWDAGYLFSWGSGTSAVFTIFDGLNTDERFPVLTGTAETFASVMADQPIAFTAPSNILAANNLFPSGSYVTLYNAAGGGALPPEIDSRIRYRVTTHFSGGFGGGHAIYFTISHDGVTPIVFSAASGNNFVKSDPRIYWTLTDVGV